MRLATLERQLIYAPEAATFSAAECGDLPKPVLRYLTAAIAPGTPLATSARLRMRGRIKLGRWLPFRARRTLAPHHGFVWAARVAGAITGYDRYGDGEGELRWKLLGLVNVMRADGPDISRSAAGRGASEACFLPTTLLSRFGVAWAATDTHHVTATYHLDDVPLTAHYTLDDAGRLQGMVFDRWGDPDDTGVFGWHTFGCQFTRHATFHRLTVPSAGRVGWFPGTDRWGQREFFRYEITDLTPTTSPPPARHGPPTTARRRAGDTLERPR